MGITRILIVVGATLVALGILWPWLSQIGFGRLPGDIGHRAGELSSLRSDYDEFARQRGDQRALISLPLLRLDSRR